MIRAGVMGWPVEHSRSPLLHGFWLKQHGIDGAYELLPVPPEDLEAALRGLAAQGFAGCNLTVPHKQAALAIVDEVDAMAARIGAVNTVIVRRDGSLEGRNTDAFGFRQNLRAAQPAWRASAGPAVVLGAGGAAHAVVYGLIGRGVGRIIIVNRTRSRAEVLRERFGSRVHVAEWGDAAVLADAGLLVNATTLGMAGQPELPIDVKRLAGHAVVADLVYVPLRTPLLRAAHERGLRTADGLGMLLHQAVRGFALWFGKTPEVTGELRGLVEADLGSSAA